MFCDFYIGVINHKIVNNSTTNIGTEKIYRFRILKILEKNDVGLAKYENNH